MAHVCIYGYRETELEVVSLIEQTLIEMGCFDTSFTIDVDYETDDNMDGAFGWCWGDREDKQITIQLNDNILLKEEFYRTVIHETVHASQLIRGVPMDEEEAYHQEEKLYSKFFA